MEGIYLLLAVIFLGTMIYVLISSRINLLVDNRLRQFYETTIKRDMQDFYREIESYTSMLESRVNQMKQLLDRQEKNTHRFESSVHLAKKIDPAGESAQFLSKLNEIGVEKKEPENLSLPQQSLGFAEKPVPEQQPAQASEPNVEEPAQKPDFSPARVPKYNTYAAHADKPGSSTNLNDDSSMNKEDLDALLESTVQPDSLAGEPPVEKSPVQVQDHASSNEQGPWVLEPVRKLGKSIATVFNMNGDQPERPAPPQSIPETSFGQRLNDNVVIVPEPPASVEQIESSDSVNKPNSAFLKDLKGYLSEAPPEEFPESLAVNESTLRQKESSTETTQVEEPKPSSILSKNVDEFMLLVSQIKRRENRHEALKKLLDQNIPMDKIAEFADVSVGELEVLRNVHRL